ncbi:hypothetical protein GBAR_LOCUS16535 [Geodia barretti]|uniref:DRTGG domain-containing protein n=1 Tax=Geodia barretti TaxID=519541 RepID=A0AA35SFK2_GEOBA|nr:hypothetical protein GBAR_LOCUS16535 [Geodia barretti]
MPVAPVIVYLTGYRQHAGKTVTSLASSRSSAACSIPSTIGYIKPVGQEVSTLRDGMQVDKDVQLLSVFSSLPGFEPRHLSPVRFTSGFTRNYLESGDQEALTRTLERRILESVASLADKKVIIAEGSGHPGVGAIAGLSNADVGNLLNAEIVFLSEGGIGRAIDTLEVYMSYFLHKRCRVRGVIFNKLIPEKIRTLQRYLTEDALNSRFPGFGGNLSILGFIPTVQDLPQPSIDLVLNSLRHAEAIGDPRHPTWQRPCRTIRVISLPAQFLRPAQAIRRRDLVVISANSSPRIRSILSYHRQLGATRGIGGLVLTCDEGESLAPELRAEIIGAGLPTVLIRGDSAATEARLFGLYESTKLQVYDVDKVREVEELFSASFDVYRFLDVFGIE